MKHKHPISPELEAHRIVREPERKMITGLSRTQWWRLENQGRVPKRIKLSDTAHGWPLGELMAWLDERKAERTADSRR
jgi:prophage regulatory protein